MFQNIVKIVPKDFGSHKLCISTLAAKATSYQLLYIHIVTTDSKAKLQILDKTEWNRGWYDIR